MQLRADRLGDVLGIVVEIGEEHQELVAALASEHVGVAEHAAQAGRDRRQELVPGGVAELVVDGLEVVEVDEQQRDRAAHAASPREREVELILDQDAVGQPGEAVVIGEVGELLLTAQPLGDVARDPVHDRVTRSRPRDERQRQLDRQAPAVGAARRSPPSGGGARVQSPSSNAPASPRRWASRSWGSTSSSASSRPSTRLAAVAEHQLGGGIELEDPPAAVERDHGVERGLDHRPLAGQGVLQVGELIAALDRLRRMGGDADEHVQELVVGAAGPTRGRRPRSCLGAVRRRRRVRRTARHRRARQTARRSPAGALARTSLLSLSQSSPSAGMKNAPRHRNRGSSIAVHVSAARHVTEQLARPLAPEYGSDLVFVGLGPVQVDHDRAEAERLGHDLGDRAQELGQLASAAHQSGELQQATQMPSGWRLSPACVLPVRVHSLSSSAGTAFYLTKLVRNYRKIDAFAYANPAHPGT